MRYCWSVNRRARFSCLASVVLLCAGCATSASKSLSVSRSIETTDQKIDAAQKVLGGFAGREITRPELMKIGRDMRNNEEARSAVSKIVGANSAPVVKYSPVTGKHYSGELEFDPETGARLEILEE